MHYDKMANQTPIRTMHCTHPQLNCCHDNTKLACHRRACSKVEWIYTRTKVSGQGCLELALEMKVTKCTFFTILKTASSGISDGFHGCCRA